MEAIYENHYLTDNDVANFARQSFGKYAKDFNDVQNENLIKFLARGMASNDWATLLTEMCILKSTDEARKLATYLRCIPEHWVPFGHPHISIRVSAPVPIARQAFKHKIGFVESEESRRYISSKPEFFIPEYFRLAADNVKQGSSDEPHPDNDYWQATYIDICRNTIKLYLEAIEVGVCPEQARFFLPQGTEVKWVWTGSLYAFANAYNQRTDSHAQKEIQDLFKRIGGIIEPLYPISWAALTQGNY